MAIKNLKKYADTLRANKMPYTSLWDEVSELMGDGTVERLNGFYGTIKMSRQTKLLMTLLFVVFAIRFPIISLG